MFNQILLPLIVVAMMVLGFVLSPTTKMKADNYNAIATWSTRGVNGTLVSVLDRHSFPPPKALGIFLSILVSVRPPR